MKRFLLFIALAIAGTIPLSAQTGAFNGFCTQGGKSTVTQGLNSSNKAQILIPSCTVTVYLTGTTTKATIFKDAISTPLANPFTADSLSATAPGKWLFFAATGQGYDVVMSGGIAPLTFTAPVTLTDLILGGGGGGSGCVPTGPNGFLLAVGSTGCAPVPADYAATLPDTFTFYQNPYLSMTATAASCDGTNCSITVPNNLIYHQRFYIPGAGGFFTPNNFDPYCMGYNTSHGFVGGTFPLVTSATSTTVTFLENDTACTGPVSGAGGSVFALDATNTAVKGFNVFTGTGGINLVSEDGAFGSAGNINIEGFNTYIGADVFGSSGDGELYLYAAGEDGIHMTTLCFGINCAFPNVNGSSIHIESSININLAAYAAIHLAANNGIESDDTSTFGTQINEGGTTGPIEISNVGGGQSYDTTGGFSWDDNSAVGWAMNSATGTGNFSAHAFSFTSGTDTAVVSPTITLTTTVPSGFTANGSEVCTFATGCGAGAGVTSINTVAGAYTFNFSAGAGNCTGTTCTFTGSGAGGGSVTNFIANAGSWPTWLVPSVATSTTTPTLSVAAGPIPNAALANASTTVNGQTCTLGSTCTITTIPSSSTVSSAEVVSFSATPTFSIAYNASRIVLTGNITTFTLGAASDGQDKKLCFEQGAGPYTVSPPANVHGFFAVGTNPGAWNCQLFVYDGTDSIWLALSTGALNM